MTLQPDMPQLTLTVLGGFEARLGNRAVPALAKKTQALLAYLALEQRPSHPRRELATLLWGDTGDAQAHQSLRKALSTLRQSLGARADDVLSIQDSSVGLNPGAVEVDARRFERLAADGSAAALDEAARLYRGPLLAGLDLDEGPFNDWLLAQRERLREQALKALGRLLAHHVEAGASDPAVETASRLLALEPLNEPAHRALMTIFAKQGRRAAAVRQYKLCVEALGRELGVKPEAATEAVYREVLAAKAPAESSGAARLLVVEDEIVTREHLTHVLGERGYDVVVAEDGADALLKLSADRFDLILSDIGMPFLDGLTLLDALRHKGIVTPLIVISGQKAKDAEARALTLGAADYLTKPIETEVLLLRVARALGLPERLGGVPSGPGTGA